jgi:hypothetical protein
VNSRWSQLIALDSESRLPGSLHDDAVRARARNIVACLAPAPCEVLVCHGSTAGCRLSDEQYTALWLSPGGSVLELLMRGYVRRGNYDRVPCTYVAARWECD